MIIKKLPYGWLILWFGFALFSQLFFHHSFDHSLDHTLEQSSASHWFGFDAFGRDLLATTLQASKLSAFIALMTTIACGFLALAIGGSVSFFKESSKDFSRFRHYSSR